MCRAVVLALALVSLQPSPVWALSAEQSATFLQLLQYGQVDAWRIQSRGGGGDWRWLAETLLQQRYRLAQPEGGPASPAASAASDTPGQDQDLVLLESLAVLAELEAGRVDRAIELASALVRKLPDHPLSHNLLGAAYLAKGDVARARQSFQQALRLQPDLLAVQVNLARLDLKEGDTAAAEARYRAVLERDPQYLDALLGMADVNDQLGRPEQAAEWLEQAWQTHPGAYDVGLSLVKRYLELNRLGAALDTAKLLRQGQPQEPAVVRAYGLALLANGDAEGAQQQFQWLLEREPQSAELWHLLATAQLRRQDSASAAASLDKALALAPDYLPSLIVRFQLQQQGRQPDAALATAQEIQRRYPQLSVGYQLEGELHQQQGELGKAIENYASAYAKAPSAPLALALAAVQRQAGADESALITLRGWLQEHPDDLAVRSRLAQYLDQMQRREEAIAEYQRILAQQPDNMLALNNLAWLYNALDDRRAIGYAERAFELAPERPEILDTLGWTLVQHGGDVERGLRLLQEAVLRAPQLADIRYHLAAAYEKANRLAEARQEVEKLLSSDELPGFSYREQAKALHQRLLERGS
ncbi:MAG TPA: XrtA/PEP-CTERM system TPR-repeat protein PrsT [Candidatus Competibacteraceae bacterium]|nr:XrtA/PEP-CTERM system TPR-repeat protein PrsT [Candidatus Competibacteraceae bacterium]